MRMSFPLLVAVLSLTSSAWAMPKVGDDAVYSSTQTSATGVTTIAKSEMKLTAYDATNDAWTLQETAYTNGTPTSTSHVVSSQQLISAQMVQQLMSACTQSGGTVQSITVPAGTFSACATQAVDTDCSGTIWIAQVAFGMVKKDCISSSTGTHIVTLLQSQVMAQ